MSEKPTYRVDYPLHDAEDETEDEPNGDDGAHYEPAALDILVLREFLNLFLELLGLLTPNLVRF